MSTPDILIPILKSNGDFFILEIDPSKATWPELREIWANAGCKLPISFAPPEEKLDVFFSYACQTAGLPISIGTVFNPGWSEMLLGKIEHDCLVVSAELVSYLAEKRLFKSNLEQLKLLIVVGTAPVRELERIQKTENHLTIYTLPHPASKLTA